MNDVPKPKKLVKAFFQQVVKGDIDKFYDQSNISKSGGGARDLRISPYRIYWFELAQFFPEVVNDRERRGNIVSSRYGFIQENVTFMAPTDARPNECRICTMRLIHDWKISYDEFNEAVKDKLNWFYLLTLDEKGVVWASRFRSDKINEFPDMVRNAIEKAIKDSGKRKIKGIINF